MSLTTVTQSANHRTATAFEQYVSGRRSFADGTGTVFFLESQEHLDEVRRITAPEDVVFVPGSTAEATDGVAIVGYDGLFLEPGDEMTLDGRHTFELQDYLAAPFISIVGLTVVRQGSAEGVSAFLTDADTARHSGVFVDQLLSSAVLLESRSAFTSTGPVDPAVVRVHVSADGEYRDGPDGLLLGRIGDGRHALEAVAEAGAGTGRSLARIIDQTALTEAVDERPWLGRYVAALDLLRQWDGAREGLAISGFGGHLVSALDHDASWSIAADAPFLVTGHGEEFILVERESRRRFRLGADAARVAECLIATGDESSASDLLAMELGQPAQLIRVAVQELRTKFSDAGLNLTAFSGTAA